MWYIGTESWFGKTELRFTEGRVDDQGHLKPFRKGKSLIKYREEMLPLVLMDINLENE